MPAQQGKFSRVKAGAKGFGEGMRHVGDLGLAGTGSVRQAWRGMASNAYGGAFRAGVAEAFGFQYAGPNHGTYRGFLGWKDTPVAEAIGESRKSSHQAYRLARKHRLSQAASRKLAKESFRAGVKRNIAKGGVKMLGRTAGAMAGRAIFPAFTAYSIYEGYQSGGIIGAAKAGATEAAIWGGFKLAGAVLGGASTTIVGAAAAGLAGYYAVGEAAQAHVKGLRSLEMGAPVKDPYGTGATLRARSMQALNSSAVNGRMAMGNEALLMHDSAYSPGLRR